jgi:site-specific DNA recombinase
MRLLLYARKSKYRGNRTKQGRSVREQLDAGYAWAVAEGHEVAAEYVDDDRSASTFATAERERFEDLIDAIEARTGDVVWTWDASRAQRDLAVYVRLRDACKDAGVLWHYNGRTYDLSQRSDRKASAYDAIDAEDQAAGISENVKRAFRANAMAGRPHGPSPWWLERVYDPKTRDLLEIRIVPDRAELILELAEAVAQLKSREKLAEALNGRGLRAPRGGPWTHNTIRMLLTNPALIGHRTHNGEDMGRGQWPPVITDMELWYRLQGIFNDPALVAFRDPSVKHLLSGVARCAECGKGAQVIKHARGAYLIYWCRAERHFAVRKEPVDDYVVRVLTLRFARRDARALFAVEHRRDERTAKLLADLAGWQNDLREAEEAVAARELSVARLAGLEQRLDPLIRKAQAELERSRTNPLLARLIRDTPEEVFRVWEGLEIAQQRSVLRAVAKISITGPGKGFRRDPSEFVAVDWRAPADIRLADQG